MNHASPPPGAHQVLANSEKLASFQNELKLVKRARFNCASRLEVKHRVGLFALSVAGIYPITLSALLIIYNAHQPQETLRLWTLVSLIGSVFFLVVGLVENLKNHPLQSHMMHECALGVNEIQRRLKTKYFVSAGDLERAAYDYSQVLARCPFNHDSIDYMKSIAEDLWRNKRDIYAISYMSYVSVRYYFNIFALNAIFLIVPGAVLYWPD